MKTNKKNESTIFIISGVLILVGAVMFTVLVNSDLFENNSRLIIGIVALGWMLFAYGASSKLKNLVARILLIIGSSIVLTFFTFYVKNILLLFRYGFGA